jgi:hypothetical protein
MAGRKHKAEHKILRGRGLHLQRDNMGRIQDSSFQGFKTVASSHYEYFGEKTKVLFKS